MANFKITRGATARGTLIVWQGDSDQSGREDLTGYTASVAGVIPPSSAVPNVSIDAPGQGEIELYWPEEITPRLPVGKLAYEVQIALMSPGGDREIFKFKADVE